MAETKTDPKTDPKTEPKTEPRTEPRTIRFDLQGRPSHKENMKSINTEHLEILDMHNTLLLYFLFGSSLVLMFLTVGTFLYYRSVIDFHTEYGTDYWLTFGIFFLTANAMVVFRVCGVSMLTQIIHGTLHGIAMGLLIVGCFDRNDPEHDGPDYYTHFYLSHYMLLSVYGVQTILAFPFAAFIHYTEPTFDNPSNTWLHILMGSVTFFLLAWNFILQMNMICVNLDHSRMPDLHEQSLIPPVLLIWSFFYILCILLIVLIPNFNYLVRKAIDRVIKERKKNIKKRTKSALVS